MNPIPYFLIRIIENFGMLGIIFFYHPSILMDFSLQLNSTIYLLIVASSLLTFFFLLMAWRSAKKFHWSELEESNSIELLIPKNEII